MGSTCQTPPQPEQPLSLPIMVPPSVKPSTLSARISSLQKIPISNPYKGNVYNFILSIKESEELIKVACPIVKSYSDCLSLDVNILNLTQKTSINETSPPIIDAWDNSDSQIMHKITLKHENNIERTYGVKVYKFENENDLVLKNGLYEAYLYRLLEGYIKNSKILVDLFVIEKVAPYALVFIFRNYTCSLEDMLIYRKESNFPYTKEEQLYITNQLLQKYKILQINNITHRDIRPSKIYLSTENNTGYDFVNLESARRISENERSFEENEMWMSVRGIPGYCSGEVEDLHMRKESAGIYDTWKNDRWQLAKTLAALITLTPFMPTINAEHLKKYNKELYTLIKELQTTSKSLTEIIREFQEKNHQASNQNNILESDLKILQNNLPQLLKKTNKKKIQECTDEVLFTLHHRELIMERMTKRIENNWRDKRDEQNVPILGKLGTYYENLGDTGNEFYREQIELLVKLSKERREAGYDNQELLDQANLILYEKFAGQTQNKSTNLSLKIEEAYSLLSKGDNEGSLKKINEAFVEGGATKNFPIESQISLLKSRGIIEGKINGFDAGQTFFEKGLEISNNRNNFITEVEMLEAKSDFEFLIAKGILGRLEKSGGNNQGKVNDFAKCEGLLISSKEIKSKIPMKNPISLANVYESFGDLSVVREDYQDASENYDRAYNLEASSEVTISPNEKIRLLEKLHNHHKKFTENYTEEERIKQLISTLKSPKSQNDRPNRPNFKRMRDLKDEKGRIFTRNTENEIKEVDERFEYDTSHMAGASGVDNSNSMKIPEYEYGKADVVGDVSYGN